MNQITIKKIQNRIEALYKERQNLSTGSDWNQGVFAGIEMVRDEINGLLNEESTPLT